MLRDMIRDYIERAALTSMSIAGGYMPHCLSSKEITSRDIHFGLQRTCGWVVPISIIERERARENSK